MTDINADAVETKPLRSYTRRICAAFGCCAAILGVAACSESPPQRAVILVTIDTLRADALGSDEPGAASGLSINAFAHRGARFDWAFSTCSYTIPSHASIMVGRYPSFHSVGLMNGQQRLVSEEETLAEILRAAGFRTAAITSNAVLNRRVGLDQGFETYDDRLPDREIVRKLRERRATNAVDLALEKLRAFDGEAFFLWLHIQDPHGPYTPPVPPKDLKERVAPEVASIELPFGRDHSGYRAIPGYQKFEEEHKVGQYARRYHGEIEYVDRELARIFEYLDATERLEETLVVLTADHGEGMGEDDFYFQHGHSVGLEQVHVPLIVVGGGVAPGRVVETPVTNMDIFATVLEFLEQPIPEGSQSRAFFSALRDHEQIDQRVFFTESYTQLGVVDKDVYLRKDRVPASNKRFWRASPLSGGTIVPLGTERVELRPSKYETQPSSTEIERRLNDFGTRARAAREAFGKRAASPVPRADLSEELRALGYIE